ncbi:hypothetical protein V8G54_001709 [Vigna mungo]|uniref:Response regulatory domain-containing protein n=1 Tax=Vigna mungo TaxID=3915 RepID=A0AAQ3P8S8_VIGMU
MAGISSPAINISEFPSNLNVLVIDTDLRVLEFIEKSCKEDSHQVMSEDYSSISMTKAFDLGACDYFKKPFDDDYWLNLWSSMFKHHIYLKRKKKNIDSLDDEDEISEKSDNSEFASDRKVEAYNTLQKKD